MADAVRTFQRVAVIGAGAWGTTLARLLADTGLHVRLWAYEREVVEAIRHKHENTLFLPGVRLPTAVVLAGEDVELVRRLQALLMTPFFRVYAGTDLIGVQLGGALKNVMALAAGVVDGLGLGHNTRAALITRGLAEMVRLGTAMGADPRTFYGLSGVGDLVLTCTGALSRNYTVGLRLGKGHQLQEILKETHAVAEGVRTAKAAKALAERYRVEMPIVREVCAVLFEGKDPRRAVTDLMVRAAKDETVS